DPAKGVLGGGAGRDGARGEGHCYGRLYGVRGPGVRRRSSNGQASMTNKAAMTNAQRRRWRRLWDLVIGIWSFIGHWDLVIGDWAYEFGFSWDPAEPVRPLLPHRPGV